MYTENTSDAWHIPRYPTREHCTTSIYSHSHIDVDVDVGVDIS